jgi:putative RNA 2'-phosphotransferase
MRPVYICTKCGVLTEETTHCGTKTRLLLSGESREKLSHLMSYLLRHNPGIVGLKMDKEGWVEISELVEAIRNKWPKGNYSWVKQEHVLAVALLDPKGRYQVEANRVRTIYGHSRELGISIQYEVDNDSKVLYHGTALKNLEKIMREGIKPMKRKYVHLTTDPRDAYEAATRHGTNTAILTIDAECLRKNGYKVYIATERIRLAEYVPPHCITAINYSSST